MLSVSTIRSLEEEERDCQARDRAGGTRPARLDSLPSRNLLDLLKRPGHSQIRDPGEGREAQEQHVNPRCPIPTRLPEDGLAIPKCMPTPRPACSPGFSLCPFNAALSPKHRGDPGQCPATGLLRGRSSDRDRSTTGRAGQSLTSGPASSTHPGQDGSFSWQGCSWMGPGGCGGKREIRGGRCWLKRSPLLRLTFPERLPWPGTVLGPEVNENKVC